MNECLYQSQNTHLSPRKGVKSTGVRVVDGKTAGLLNAGTVPRDGDHHVDREVDRNKIGDDPMISDHRAQQSFTSLKNKINNYSVTISHYNKRNQYSINMIELTASGEKSNNCTTIHTHRYIQAAWSIHVVNPTLNISSDKTL